MIDAPAVQAFLETGVSGFAVVDTYAIGSFTVTSSANVIRRGAMSGSEGLDPKTLDVTVVLGGEDGPGAALKAAALAGDLFGADFVYTQTFVGGGTATRFTGTVQRVEVSSTELRVVAMTATVDLDAAQLPNHVILSSEFPEIPPPENYNVR